MADSYDVNKDRYITTPYPGPSMPARRAIPVTPSDTKDVTNATGDNAPCYAKALLIGVAGNINVIMAGDNTSAGVGAAVVLPVPAGWAPVQVRRVLATLTTATGIVGLYDQ